MSSEDIEAYTVEARTGSDKARKSSDGQYLSVHLPEHIQSLGFEEGDSVYLDLSSSEVDGHEIFYLKGSKEEISRHSLKIRKRDDLYPPYFVRLPIEYTFHREEQSFHGLEPGDELNVEVDRDKEEFRIYTADDFRYRSKQFSDEYGLPPVVKQPSKGIPLLGGSLASMLSGGREYARIANDPPDEVEAGSKFSVKAEVSAPELDNASLQHREPDGLIWSSVYSLNEVEGRYAKFSGEFSFDELGEHEFRVNANHMNDPVRSEVHTVTVVESEDE